MKSRKEKRRQYSESLITVILVLLAVCCVAGVVRERKSGALFFPLNHRPVLILSGSMEPELQTGGVVLIRKTKEVRAGDMIFFLTKEGTPVVHRLQSITDQGELMTKGDANPREDTETVSQDRLKGKVVFHTNGTAPVFRMLSAIFGRS